MSTAPDEFDQTPASGGSIEPIEADTVRSWFADPIAVDHYARAAWSLGLWRSEAAVFTQVFRPEEPLLDLGCGAGRIALGLWRLGFADITGADFCAPLVEEAASLAEAAGCLFRFLQADARELPFEEGRFRGVVFGFNGLMQIPGRTERRRALTEIRRVTAPGRRLVFTTHDRDLATMRASWAQERQCWEEGRQDPRLLEFGDRILDNPEGRIFMHLPDRAEILEDLATTGWTHLEDHLRSTIANESAEVREFSEDCRFWIAVNSV